MATAPRPSDLCVVFHPIVAGVLAVVCMCERVCVSVCVCSNTCVCECMHDFTVQCFQRSACLCFSLSLSPSTLPPSFMLSLQNSHSISSLFFLLSYSQALSLSAKKAALMMHKAYQLCMHTHTHTPHTHTHTHTHKHTHTHTHTRNWALRGAPERR